MTSRRIGSIALLLAITSSLAFASSPRLSIIMPRGIERGKEHVVTFSGSNLGDAKEIFFYEKGFEVIKLEGKGNSVKATIRVASDARLGEHVAQVRTATGISDYRTFFVGALEAVPEKEPNSDFNAPQAIRLNVTVEGIVQNEDVDYYVVEAKKGQRISAEVEGMRLGSALFDPYVAILDAKRFELGAADDTALALQDPATSVVAKEDGKYIIEVRESAYGGNGSSRYRLHVGTFPRPTAVYPAGGKIGTKVAVNYLGLPSGELKEEVTLPKTPNEEYGLFARDEGGIAPSANAFRLFEHGNAFEKEPNNELAKASVVELPNAFNGIIEKKGDVDFFRFKAKKGQVFEIECYARRVRSGLDPVMNLYNAKGGSLAGSDDSRGPDSYFRYTFPADGEYILRITDHLGRGAPDFVYRVEFQTMKPRLALGIPRVERYGQYRQQIYVAKGNRFGTIINASRANFGGELELLTDNLPKGIKVHTEKMASNMSSMPVVFEADANAELSGKLIEFTAKHTDPKQNISGFFRNSSDFIVGAPGQSIYKRKAVAKLAVAVVDKLPFKVEIVEPKVPIVRNGSMQLPIRVIRDKGFKGAVNVQLPFRPPGIGAASSINIPGDKEIGYYPLSANGGAAIKKWKIYALGSSNVGGTAWASSQLATLEIAAPYVTFAMQRASCEQGEDAQILCTLNHATAFEGKAKVQLLGLPAKVTTTELEFTKGTKELIFNVKTDKTSPAGKHKNVFTQITITQNGENIVSRGGATELQIDKPLPAPAKPAPKPMAKPKAVVKKATPPPVKKKPLTRLQKLRLAAKQRAEAKAKAAAGGEEE